MSLIRSIACATALLACTHLACASQAGEARQGSSVSFQAKDGDGPERVGPRQHAESNKPYLLATNRWTEMMLKDDAVYLQMSNYGMKQVAEPQDARKTDEGFFGNMVRSMALSGVKQLLDHSLALALTDMRKAIVRDGEVILVTCKGKEVFNKVKINDQVQKFPQDQAESFVGDVNRLRAGLPACR